MLRLTKQNQNQNYIVEASNKLGSEDFSRQEMKKIFEMDYDFYFRNNHGLFVVKTNIQYELFKEIKKNRDIKNEMVGIP